MSGVFRQCIECHFYNAREDVCSLCHQARKAVCSGCGSKRVDAVGTTLKVQLEREHRTLCPVVSVNGHQVLR